MMIAVPERKATAFEPVVEGWVMLLPLFDCALLRSETGCYFYHGTLDRVLRSKS